PRARSATETSAQGALSAKEAGSAAVGAAEPAPMVIESAFYPLSFTPADAACAKDQTAQGEENHSIRLGHRRGEPGYIRLHHPPVERLSLARIALREKLPKRVDLTLIHFQELRKHNPADSFAEGGRRQRPRVTERR